jgi:glycosyltransferase involved in cell wall biosynthesis
MSVYNEERYIYESVMSICSQSYSDFEFIIIDDASTDNTVKIIEKINDSRIKLIKNNENKGLPHNLNVAIGMAKGKYIARMDGDDVADRKRLDRQVEFMEINTNIDICGTWGISISENGRKRYKIRNPVCDEDIKKRLVCVSSIIHPSVMIRKEVFNSVMYDENYKSAQDYKLWADCWKYKFYNIPEYLIYYRKNVNGISLSERKDKERKKHRLLYLMDIYRILLSNINKYYSEEQLYIYSKMVSNLVGFTDEAEIYRALEIRKEMENSDSIDKKILISRWRTSVPLRYQLKDFMGFVMGVIYRIRELINML